MNAVRGQARTALLEAALRIIRTKGLNATSVDELCAAAGVTKGAFFHHFESKEALAVAAANHWTDTTSELFVAAPYHTAPTAADRILAYVEFRAAMIDGPMPEWTCLVGTMAQEAYETSPAVRDACAHSISSHAASLEADMAAALAEAGRSDVDPASLALHTQVVVQGAFVVAKAADDPAIARDSLAHLRRYLECLFGREAPHR